MQTLNRHATPSMMFSTNTSKEQKLAQDAKDTGEPTIFDKIISKEIPSKVVYEDEHALAFRDVNP